MKTLSGYEDVYLPEVQKYLIEKAEEGEIEETISDAIEINERRANQKYGLWRRTRNKKASRSEWKNPVDADGVPIYARKSPGQTKVNNRLHTPFDRTIITNNNGYFLGKPIQFKVDESLEDNKQEIMDDLSNNFDLNYIINEQGQAAIGRGSGFLICSKIEDDNNLYITALHDWNCIILYDQVTNVPKYGIVYFYDVENNVVNGEQRQREQSRYNIYWYDGVTVTEYEGGKGSVSKKSEPEPHFMGTFDSPNLPLIEFPNNSERIGDVELTMSLQDAFDIADSDLSSEISQLRLAYLLISGEGHDIDDEYLNKLKETGVLTVSPDGDAKFVIKDLNSSAVENLKKDLEGRIIKYSNSYDPMQITGSNVTAFEISQRLFKLESATSEREALFTVSIKRLWKIIVQYYAEMSNISVDDALSMVELIFTRNIPQNRLQDLVLAAQAGMTLSNQTKVELSQLGIDAQKEAERIEAEQEAIMNRGVQEMQGAFTK